MWDSLHKNASRAGENQPLLANYDSRSPILPLTNHFARFAKEPPEEKSRAASIKDIANEEP